MILNILKYGNPILKQHTQNVEKIDDSIKALINDMFETMKYARGIGLAAPQIGESISLAVIDTSELDEKQPPICLINPVIVEFKGRKIVSEEGCLSLPGISEKISRSEIVVVSALNEKGEKVNLQFSNMMARVIQHEIDHLQGTLIIDRIGLLKRNLLKKKLESIQNKITN